MISNADDAADRVPDKYFALDHLIVRTPSVADSLKLAQQHGFVCTPGGRHADGVTENALISLADGVYIELISFTDPASDAAKSHWWGDRPDGLIDWACTGHEQEAHLTKLDGEERYEEAREGGRKTKEGKELKWRVTFPTVKPRGRLPFMCDDITPREWRVPAPPKQHDNGAVGVKSITLLAKPTRMVKLFNPLAAVLGRASEEPMGTSSDKGPGEYPPRERIFRLSTPVEPKSARIDVLVRDAATEQEQAWVAKHGEGVYECQIACEGQSELGDTLQGLTGVRLAPV